MSKTEIVLTLIIAVVIGLVIWAFLQQNQWAKECRAEGGHVVRHVDGYTTKTPQNKPTYSYACEE